MKYKIKLLFFVCIISLLSVLIIWLFTYPKYTYISVYHINAFLNKKAIDNEKVIPNIKLYDDNKSYDLKSIIKKYNNCYVIFDNCPCKDTLVQKYVNSSKISDIPLIHIYTIQNHTNANK